MKGKQHPSTEPNVTQTYQRISSSSLQLRLCGIHVCISIGGEESNRNKILLASLVIWNADVKMKNGDIRIIR